jgi:hypothetical protein
LGGGQLHAGRRLLANYEIIRFRRDSIDNPLRSPTGGAEKIPGFTCTQRAELTAGVLFDDCITTGGSNPPDIRVYLDKGTITAR